MVMRHRCIAALSLPLFPFMKMSHLSLKCLCPPSNFNDSPKVNFQITWVGAVLLVFRSLSSFRLLFVSLLLDHTHLIHSTNIYCSAAHRMVTYPEAGAGFYCCIPSPVGRGPMQVLLSLTGQFTQWSHKNLKHTYKLLLPHLNSKANSIYGECLKQNSSRGQAGSGWGIRMARAVQPEAHQPHRLGCPTPHPKSVLFLPIPPQVKTKVMVKATRCPQMSPNPTCTDPLCSKLPPPPLPQL